MTLETIYYIGQTISVVAILGSLIFVGIQVRLGLQQTEQANKLASVELSQSTGMKTLALQNGWYDTEESANFMARALQGDDPLSIADKIRFGLRMVTLFTSVEMVDTLQRDGLCDQNMHKRILITGESYCKLPRVQKWWRHVGRSLFIMPFQGTIEDMMKRGEAAQAAAGRLGAHMPVSE